MPRPTKEQLRKINKFSQIELEEDQVYVFRSLSADTLPVKRYGWFGEYSITFSERMLNKLKNDYRKGVALLASHNANRLPFGRTFDAEVLVDDVDGEQVKTLYIDHYIVTHLKDEEGNKIPIRTEINGMTTQDIVNHIEVGHTFDTSIGFTADEIKCSICGNDIRDFEKCEHVPGAFYELEEGDNTVRKRCDIIVDYGEGIENSLVYAGAVDRAIIQSNKRDLGNESLSVTPQQYDSSVNFGGTRLYNVDDLKNIPKGAKLFCYLSKGNLQIYTNTVERRDFQKFIENKEREKMAVEIVSDSEKAFVVSEEEFNQLKQEKDQLEAKLKKAEEDLATLSAKLVELQDQLKERDARIEELNVKAQLADEYHNDLIEQTIKAAVAARGNRFNVERYRKYLVTLSIDELKEELAAMKGEFVDKFESTRVTSQEVQLERENEINTEITLHEIRQEAGRLAMQEYQRTGGDLIALTEKYYAELRKKYNK